MRNVKGWGIKGLFSKITFKIVSVILVSAVVLHVWVFESYQHDLMNYLDVLNEVNSVASTTRLLVVLFKKAQNVLTTQ